MKASIQVKVSAISTTRFLDLYSTSFLSKNAWGLTSWALILSGSRSARSTKSPAKIFRNNLINDWSIARTHHKSFVEAWKRGGHRSGRATVRAPNHYRQVCGGRGGKSRDNRRTIKWDVSWIIKSTTSVPEDWEVEQGVPERKRCNQRRQWLRPHLGT